MFKVFRIRLYYLRVLRGISIVYTLLGFFIINWMSVRRYTYFLIPRKYKINGAIRSMPERLRIVIEELGPTFVKFGQIIADRPDIVSEKLRFELKKLQSMAEPIDHDFAMRLIEEELGTPIEKYFAHVNREQCIGAASIGQVYQGRLINGDEVVIKIQRPDIEDKIELDLQLLKYLAQQLVEEYPGFAAVDIVGFVEEFGETLKQEMNYVSEAANIVRFGDMFKDVTYCKIPRVYLELSTPRLLVLEYISGTPPDSIERLVAQGLDPDEIAINGIHVLMTMIFKHGFFHADPHPGNLFVQPGNRIALIDFGMVGSLKPSHMHFLAGFILGLAKTDARIITESLLTLCGKKFFADKDDLEFYVNDMLTRHGSFNYEKINFSQILNESIKIMLKYELKIPASIYLLLKALATIENFGAKLNPHLSLPTIIKPYAEELIKKRYSPTILAHEVFDTLKDYVSLVRDFPAEMNEILFKLKQGKLIHEIHLGEHELMGKVVRSAGGTIALAVMIGFMLAGSIILGVWGKSPWMGDVMFSLAAFFSFWFLMRLFLRSGS
ncbi:MAG: Ubiquinone biosynthesis monooxygenase UbiB [Bacteroidota bacterium]|nr:Ubiquinone biosynthesis monooxygenase UbiB [Bacteroidota bacterium]